MKRGARRLTVAGAIAAAVASLGSARAFADDDLRGAQVVYAKGASLWKIDARGKGRAIELAALPGGAAAGTVRAIRADATGHTLVVDVAGAWYWSHLDGDTATPLAPVGCAPGGAVLDPEGTCVVCATDKGTASIHTLATGGKRLDRDVPAAGASLAGAAGARALIWADATGVWSAPAAAATLGSRQKKPLAPEPPLSHFSAAPDGGRALGVYKAADEKGAALLYSFALDGGGARRKVIRNGVPIEWSWDSQWVLVQDGAAACVMRAIGGEYKCWKGYTAVGIAEDGAWALVVGSPASASAGGGSGKNKGKSRGKDAGKGKRAGKGKDAGKGAAKGKTTGKSASKTADAPVVDDNGVGGDDGGEGSSDGADGSEGTGDDGDLAGADDGDGGGGGGSIDETVVPMPKRPFSLYRARRDGAFTDRPIVIVSDVDGPAAWLPGAPTTTPAPAPAAPR